ncbi:MAG: hypothetical protein KKE96_06940 [Candidatus Altiarchaeota archaeon]|nr:hypothetical protein [Candidatus Altiarchaeota archaeon]MBU4342305.1 hypothetical protein [Candidatus Altiarchaeota archaeon]
MVTTTEISGVLEDIRVAKGGERTEDALIRVYFHLLISKDQKDYPYGMYNVNVLLPVDKEGYKEELEKWMKWKEFKETSGKRGKMGKPEKANKPHTRSVQQYQNLLQRFASTPFIKDLRLEDGKHYYQANPEVINAFIRRYSLSQSEYDWHIELINDAIKRGDKSIFENMKRLRFEEAVLYFLSYSATNTGPLIGSDIVFATYSLLLIGSATEVKKCMDKEIKDTNVSNIDSNRLSQIRKICPFAKKCSYLNAYVDGLESEEAMDNYLKKKKKKDDAGGALIWFYADIIKKLFPIKLENSFELYLRTLSPKGREEIINFVDKVPDHFIRDVYGEDKWKSRIKGILEKQ